MENKQKNRLILITATLIVLVALAGCANQSEPRVDAPADSGVIGTIPPDSKFAKISVGMTKREVIDLIGEPTDEVSYITGKAFIPFYYGADTGRSELLYKGEGRITIQTTGGAFGPKSSGNFKVLKIVYDPSESGYGK
jgi:hypothetical protein